jgi:hypothetical protein
MNLTYPAPEWLAVANAYLEEGSIAAVSAQLGMRPQEVTEILAKKDVRSYLDNIYLDMGYRNRTKLAEVFDRIIDSKLEEAAESGVYSTKDLADILMMVHKMRMDEIKSQTTKVIENQTNVQINGDGNYGKLMEKLLGS